MTEDGIPAKMTRRCLIKEDLRLFSPITWALERCFYAAQYLSPANLLFGTRVESQQRFTNSEAAQTLTIWRSRRIEAYVLSWCAVELGVAVVVPGVAGLWLALLLLPAFRLFEIVQAAVNLNLFDRLRLRGRKHYVATVARTMLLSLWNFFELILCFGIFYSSRLAMFEKPITSLDAYYFSVITQLTIGYGDIQPVGITRAAAAIQGLLGFVFALFALSRLIAFLPRTEAVLGDE